MNTLSPFLSVPYPCDQALQLAKQQLSRAGLRPIQTFDLHTARLGLLDCPCPHHGTAECDCQMVVLLVYGEAPAPITLILHGNDGQTWISATDNPPQHRDKKLLASIVQALEDPSPAGSNQSADRISG